MARRNAGIAIDSTELLQNFRAARNKRDQIQIEADLHCCAPRVIAGVLDEIGALVGTTIRPEQFSDHYSPIPPARVRRKEPQKSAPRKRGRSSVLDEAKAMELFNQGISYEKMATELHVSRSTVVHWASSSGLKRQKPKGDVSMKKERPVEEALLDKEAEKERFARIMESVDAGKRNRKAEITPERTEPREPCSFPARATCEGCEPRQAEPRIAMEPREPMTVKGFRVAMCSLLAETLDAAALSINGETVHDIFGVEISVRNNEVYVDLRTREAGA